MRWSVHLVTMPVASRDRSLGDVRTAVVIALQRTGMEKISLTVCADADVRTLRLAASVTAADPASAFEIVSRDFADACVSAGVSSHARWDAVLVLPEPSSDASPSPWDG